MAPAASVPSAPEPAVMFHDAGLGHPRRVVIRRANAQALSGDRVLVVGGNGAGKSTLLATLAGLLPTIHGEIRVLGLDPMQERRKLHRQTGHLGHSPGFYPELTGRENLLLHARLRGLARTEVERQLENAGLTGSADRLLGEYSHGMQRRLGLAKAMLGAPRLLLLDEPDSGLDREAHERLGARLTDAAGTSVIMATHNPHSHLDWATKAWVLGAGRLVELEGDEDGLSRHGLDQAVQEVTR